MTSSEMMLRVKGLLLAGKISEAAALIAPDEGYAHAMTRHFSRFFPDSNLALEDGDDFLIEHLIAAAEQRPLREDNSIGQEYDFLDKRAGAINVVKAFCLSYYAQIPVVTSSCAVVVTMCNEAPYIVEWIAHQQALGFREIYVYTNNNTDGTDAVLQHLARKKIIKLCANDTSQAANPQIKAYEHAIFCDHRIRKNEWVMFLDADEFVVPSKQYDHDLVKLMKFVGRQTESPACLALNWLWYGSGGAITVMEGAVTERFSFAGWRSQFVKSIVRLPFVTSMQGVHKPYLVEGATIVGADLLPISGAGHDAPFQTTMGHINHYWNKSFAEFLIKQDRGRRRAIWERDTDLFFRWDIEVCDENFAPMEDILLRRRRVIEQEMMRDEQLVAIIKEVCQIREDHAKEVLQVDKPHVYYLEQKFRSDFLQLMNIDV